MFVCGTVVSEQFVCVSYICFSLGSHFLLFLTPHSLSYVVVYQSLGDAYGIHVATVLSPNDIF